MQTFYDELVFKVYFNVVNSRDIVLWAFYWGCTVYIYYVYIKTDMQHIF